MYIRVIFRRKFVFSEENYATSYCEILLVNRVKGEEYSNDPCTEDKVKKSLKMIYCSRRVLFSMLCYNMLRWYEFKKSVIFYNDKICNKVDVVRESNNGYI